MPALEQDFALLAELQTIAERVGQLDELLTDTTTAPGPALRESARLLGKAASGLHRL